MVNFVINVEIFVRVKFQFETTINDALVRNLTFMPKIATMLIMKEELTLKTLIFILLYM